MFEDLDMNDEKTMEDNVQYYLRKGQVTIFTEEEKLGPNKLRDLL